MTRDDPTALAERWLEHDPDPATRAELAALIASRSPELGERFAGPLEFGTAGLRGLLGAGETRMNRAVVRRATAGLGSYLLAEGLTTAGGRPVVIGYDARKMGRELAEEAAAVLCGQGLRVVLSRSLCPTPIVAFGVQHLGAAAGIMVTASHNPPAYNGYKVYAANGAQIVPPADRLIAQAIARSAPADELPTLSLLEAEGKGLLTWFGPELDELYLEHVVSLVARTGGDRTLRIAYTPLHGVGAALLTRAYAAAGFTSLHPVEEQVEPDGSFPTVHFPNPEETGTLDLAIELACRIDAPLVVANDPDADRLAVCVRAPDKTYVVLTGNQIGVLLGHYLLTREGPPIAKRLAVSTIVSSPLLGVMARELGARYAQTLTGHKWIANRSMELERAEGLTFVFGYEEALGYAVTKAVRDKDGISAGLVLGVLAAELAESGRSLLDRLDEIALRFGLFESSQRSVVLPGREGSARMAELMAALRRSPPVEIGGLRVEAVLDARSGERVARGKAPEPTGLPTSDVLVFELEADNRVIARPSGTEPKIKFYFDVREPVARLEELPAARARARALLARLEAALLARLGL